MPGQTAQIGYRFEWRYSLYAAVVAVISFIAVICIDDFLGFVHLLVVVPLVSIVFLGCAIFVAFKNRWKGAAIFVAVVVYATLSFVLYQNAFALRTTAWWFFDSRDYKTKVMAEPDSPDGLLKHIKWDSWGWATIDTVAYLVFDPNDSLSMAADSHAPGKYPGLPCQVLRVRRMESHYYVVLFYTDQVWDSCK
jgi:hypothetical protein